MSGMSKKKNLTYFVLQAFSVEKIRKESKKFKEIKYEWKLSENRKRNSIGKPREETTKRNRKN